MSTRALADQPRVILRLDRHDGVYQPGETLSGEYRLEGISRRDLEGLEVSVLWRTEGKGETDTGTHALWRYATELGDWLDPRQPGRFSTVLPAGPLSYQGAIVKILWLVRIRVFLHRQKPLTVETPFQLGEVRSVGPTSGATGFDR